MGTSLLDLLSSEVDTFLNVGDSSLQKLKNDCDVFCEELRSIESSLEDQLAQEEKGETTESLNALESIEGLWNKWYRGSIADLKTYNSGINKFLKNILNNKKLNINLDECYTYPLNLYNFPVEQETDTREKLAAGEEPDQLTQVKEENQEELTKAIILHLLKNGQCDIVRGMVNDIDMEKYSLIDESLLTKFKLLNDIVNDIVVNHDLTKAIEWFKNKYNESISFDLGRCKSDASDYSDIEFKFHILQFTLLLNGKEGESNIESALAAYLYSKENFSRFFNEHLNEISPLMTLLLFRTAEEPAQANPDENLSFRSYMVNMLQEFMSKMKQSFLNTNDSKSGEYGGSGYVGQILSHFQNIHEYQPIFVNLSNEFMSEYCRELKLSNDSSLFQSILAGFINLPNFYKYNKIQLKFHRFSILGSQEGRMKEMDNISKSPIQNNESNTMIEAGFNYDLPFQLPDSNKFLFSFHPIFICPVSKEQLIPLTNIGNTSENHRSTKKRATNYQGNNNNVRAVNNPVVVLKYCKHVALKDSVWQLSKKGYEIFKCPYCYKEHKFSDTSDAYFIDL